MKVAIVGANGFIGTRLIEKFHLGGGPDLVAVVRRPSSLALPARFQLETRLADALDPASLASAIAGCDAVVHAALGDPAQIEQMPVALCHAAAQAQVPRLVYLSSASVHGQNPPPGTDEASPLHTQHAIDYNNAKVRAERHFFLNCRRFNLQGYALRPGVVYGPRSRWIADLATELLEERAWLFAGGEGICNGIYVDNLVAAIECCLEARTGAGAPYLVGDAETITWADFYRIAAHCVGRHWDSIHQLDRLPEFRRPWSERIRGAAANPVTLRLLPLVPGKVKRSAKAALAAWSPPPRVDSWALPRAPRPQPTQEMALLQQCTWKLPHTRAEQALGYQPTTSFADAMDRSFAWWQFASGEHLAAR